MWLSIVCWQFIDYKYCQAVLNSGQLLWFLTEADKLKSWSDCMLTETCLTCYAQTAPEREKNPSCVNHTLNTPLSTVKYVLEWNLLWLTPLNSRQTMVLLKSKPLTFDFCISFVRKYFLNNPNIKKFFPQRKCLHLF